MKDPSKMSQRELRLAVQLHDHEMSQSNIPRLTDMVNQIDDALYRVAQGRGIGSIVPGPDRLGSLM